MFSKASVFLVRKDSIPFQRKGVSQFAHTEMMTASKKVGYVTDEFFKYNQHKCNKYNNYSSILEKQQVQDTGHRSLFYQYRKYLNVLKS